MKPTKEQVMDENNQFATPNNGPWKLLHTWDNFWWIGNIETGVSKKIGPVQLRGKNYYGEAVIEAARRNEKITGITFEGLADYL